MRRDDSVFPSNCGGFPLTCEASSLAGRCLALCDALEVRLRNTD